MGILNDPPHHIKLQCQLCPLEGASALGSWSQKLVILIALANLETMDTWWLQNQHLICCSHRKFWPKEVFFDPWLGPQWSSKLYFGGV